MGANVYANDNAISCKAGSSKVIASFPDVCLSPPSPPAGPVPVPYPDTSFSKDMQNGSKTVLIGDKEVMLKDQSFYKTSPLGDEAATNGLGAGVVTHVITGKTYFVAWSMDVQFEGQNVDRHIDLTTSNHASPLPNEATPMPNMDDMAIKKPDKPCLEIKCDDESRKEKGDRPFTPCEKNQICAKCANVNDQAQKKKLKRRKPATNKKLKGKKKYAQKKQRDTIEENINNGTITDQEVKDSFAHPCAYEEWKAAGGDPRMGGYDPDHVHEVQLGGHPTSPDNFKWMSADANQWMGNKPQLGSYSPRKHFGVCPTCCEGY